jgi:hypothetical protein
MLRQRGFDAANLDGGYRTWSRSPAARQLVAVGTQEVVAS